MRPCNDNCDKLPHLRSKRFRENYGDGEAVVALDSAAAGSVVAELVSDEAVAVGLALWVTVSVLCFARSRTR